MRYSWEKLHEETGVSTFDILVRMVDFGVQHYLPSHVPMLVPQPFTLEPTESYAKAELDEYVAALRQISNEAYLLPEIVKTAPHQSVTHRPRSINLDHPDKWAVTWRAYLKKCEKNLRRKIV